MMGDEDARYLSRHVCGIGYTENNAPWPDERPSTPEDPSKLPTDPVAITITGTGFLVTPTIICTARHVVDGLLNKAVREEDFVTVFVEPDGENMVVNYQRGLGGGYILVSNSEDVNDTHPAMDYAFLPLKGPPFPNSTGLMCCPREEVYIGQEIVMPSYYMGHSLMKGDQLANDRFGPLFLFGRVAAISPFGIRGQRSSREYWLDVTAAGGISGAPAVCMNTGRVIGVLRGGAMKEFEIEDGKKRRLPMNVGIALPVGDAFVTWIEKKLAEANAKAAASGATGESA